MIVESQRIVWGCGAGEGSAQRILVVHSLGSSLLLCEPGWHLGCWRRGVLWDENRFRSLTFWSKLLRPRLSPVFTWIEREGRVKSKSSSCTYFFLPVSTAFGPFSFFNLEWPFCLCWLHRIPPVNAQAQEQLNKVTIPLGGNSLSFLWISIATMCTFSVGVHGLLPTCTHVILFPSVL